MGKSQFMAVVLSFAIFTHCISRHGLVIHLVASFSLCSNSSGMWYQKHSCSYEGCLKIHLLFVFQCEVPYMVMCRRLCLACQPFVRSQLSPCSPICFSKHKMITRGRGSRSCPVQDGLDSASSSSAYFSSDLLFSSASQSLV